MSVAWWLTGDTREVVGQLPAGSVDLVLTSPPFLALRSYLPDDHPDKAKEIGSEATPADFVDTLLELTAGWRRVLAPHGSICVELGDTYAGSGGAGGDYLDGGLRDGQSAFGGSAKAGRWGMDPEMRPAGTRGTGWPEDKSLTMIPELYRVGLAYGINPLTGQPSPAGRWRVRNNVRWVRPNPPVGALGDKFRPATSDMAIACVARDRWFDLDAVRTPHKEGEVSEATAISRRRALNRSAPGNHTENAEKGIRGNAIGAPPLDWWSVSPGGYSGSHYAVMPAELCVRPIEAMCPRRVCRTCGKPSRRLVDIAYTETPDRDLRSDADRTYGSIDGKRHNDHRATDHTTTGWSSCGCPGTDGIRLDGYHTGTGWRPGIVLDPFGGSGTSGLVASGHGRDAILIDLDSRNLDLARERLGMFLTETTPSELAARLVCAPLEVATG